jgi:hypothetical protein
MIGTTPLRRAAVIASVTRGARWKLIVDTELEPSA